MAAHKIVFCFCADANFGIFGSDEKIVDAVAEQKKKCGYPERFECICAKEKNDTVFNINRKLVDAGLVRGVSVACQSLSETVLKNIGRKNMSLESFSEELKRYREAKIPTYTDLILGLPGETYESFCRGLFSVIEAGQHCAVNIFCCELLPNSHLGSPETIKKHEIETVHSLLCQNHSKTLAGDSLGSRSEIIVQTNTMSREEWKNAYLLSICAQGFHSMGLLRFFAVFLRRSQGLSYYDFYMSLFEWIKTDSVVIRNLLVSVTASIDDFLAEKGNLFFTDPRFGDIYYPFDEALFLCSAVKADEFYSEAAKHLKKYFTDAELFDDLMKYQRCMINTPSRLPEQAAFEYDWHSYFRDICDTRQPLPEKREIRLSITPAYYTDLEEYARHVVWYGKRDNLAVIHNAKIIE